MGKSKSKSKAKAFKDGVRGGPGSDPSMARALTGGSLKGQAKKPAPCLTQVEIEQKLRAHGVLPTAHRLAICQYVLCEAGHPIAEQVKLWTDKHFPKLSLATVYNTLNQLVAVGLLRELRLPHLDKSVYDSRLDKHYHFLDESSGKLFDIDSSSVRVKPKLDASFTVHSVEVILRGRRVPP